MSSLMEMALAAVPLLILLASLLLGHYPGAEAIVRLSERIARSGRRSRPSTSEPRPAPPRSHAASGGLLIALRLAQRPPPLPA